MDLSSGAREYAPVVELVDTPDLGSGAERLESSSLSGGYKKDWLFALKILPGCHKTSRFFCGPIFSVRFDLVIWLRQVTDETGKE